MAASCTWDDVYESYLDTLHDGVDTLSTIILQFH